MTTAPANRTLTRGSREPTARRWSRRALQHGAGGSGLAAGRPSRSAPEARSGTALRGRGQARSAVAVDVNDVRPGAMSLPCTERGAPVDVRCVERHQIQAPRCRHELIVLLNKSPHGEWRGAGANSPPRIARIFPRAVQGDEGPTPIASKSRCRL